MRIYLSDVGVVVAGIGMAALAACGSVNPGDERPAVPRQVVNKYIDPPHYNTVTTCLEKNKKGKCIRQETKKKETDDKDWIIVTSQGTAYDVEENEYNSVNVGDFWPR